MDIPKCEDVVLKYGNIRDIEYQWLRDEDWRRIIYEKWTKMWSRVNNNSFYKDCSICNEYIRLSNYFYDFMKLDNFDLFKENPKGWSIDKDIKIPGNREYKFEALSLVTISENSKERLVRCGNPFIDNNPSINKRKSVIGIHKDNGSIIIFNILTNARKLGLNPSHIRSCCVGNRNTHGGYKWYYLNIIEL